MKKIMIISLFLLAFAFVAHIFSQSQLACVSGPSQSSNTFSCWRDLHPTPHCAVAISNCGSCSKGVQICTKFVAKGSACIPAHFLRSCSLHWVN